MPSRFNRRTLFKGLVGAAVAGMGRLPIQGLWLSPSETIPGRGRGGLWRIAAAFKRSFSVPALSVAISRNGQFVFDQGFGFNQGFRMGNSKDLGPANMSSLFRIA